MLTRQMAEERPIRISAPLPKTPEGRGSSTAFNPTIARNSRGLFYGAICQDKAHVLNEVANAGESPVRSTTLRADGVMATHWWGRPPKKVRSNRTLRATFRHVAITGKPLMKPSILSIIRICPGRRHAWYATDIGPVRKPYPLMDEKRSHLARYV